MENEITLFLTGKLAFDALNNILAEIYPNNNFYKVKMLGVNVAALMTMAIIKNRLSKDDLMGCTRVMLPGKCKANLDDLSAHFGIPFVLGCEELKDLPTFLSKPPLINSLDKYNICVIAEIYNSSIKSTTEILKIADYYIDCGANVIDIGCLSDRDFGHLEEVIIELKQRNCRVSIDSLNPDELIRASDAGVDFLLSLSEETLWIAKESNAVPIIIPQTPNDMNSLKNSIYFMEELAKPYIADPILYPINCGFTTSLKHYWDLRNEFPNIELLMGVGNVTELVEADSMGANAILTSIATELNVNYLLTSQLNLHCRSVIKELDIARRMLYLAQKYATLPQGFTNEMLALHDKNPFPYSHEEIYKRYSMVKDPSFRINTTKEGIHIFNRDCIASGKDPFELFKSTGITDDAAHAFYLGVELAKAQISWQLGKRYNQDLPIDFGCSFNEMVEHVQN